MQTFRNTFARQANQRQPVKLKMEEAATGQTQLELEHVFYAKLISSKHLAQATSVEEHEQWEIRIEKTERRASACRMRIRKTTYPNEPARAAEYTYTVKTKNPNGGEDEITTVSTEDTFEAFKRASEVGMKKTRYVLPIHGYKAMWEIDTYKDRQGQEQPWCKIDFEVVQGDPVEIPNLPEGFEAVMAGSAQSDTIQKTIRTLYDQVFLTPNEYLSVVPAPDAAVATQDAIAVEPATA